MGAAVLSEVDFQKAKVKNFKVQYYRLFLVKVSNDSPVFFKI